MKVLLGTTNPSKVKRFSDLLKGYDIEFVTLNDIEITEEPEEKGTSPEENAIIKAKLGGKVTAYYLDGIAVYNHGVISSFMDNEAAQKTGVFDMIDKASSKRFEGWPLDSLSINKETGKYFVDGTVGESKDNIIKGQYEKSIVDFLLKSLHVDSNVRVSGTLTVNQVDSTQMASDEDVLAASSQLMKRNKHVYKELSK